MHMWYWCVLVAHAQEAFKQSGGVELVKAAMIAFPEDDDFEDVEEQGLKVLRMTGEAMACCNVS